jgi:hypothetical protein
MKDDHSMAGGSHGAFGFVLGASNSNGRMSNNRPSAFSPGGRQAGVNGSISQKPRKSIAMAETDYFKKISIKEFA